MFLALWKERIRNEAGCEFLLWQCLLSVNKVRGSIGCGRSETLTDEFGVSSARTGGEKNSVTPSSLESWMLMTVQSKKANPASIP